MLTLCNRSFSFQVESVQCLGTALTIWFGIRSVSCKACNTPIPGASKILPISSNMKACYNITIT